MTSQRFSTVPTRDIITFLIEKPSLRAEDSLTDAVESITDLWLLANMTKNYDEDYKISDTDRDSRYSGDSSM